VYVNGTRVLYLPVRPLTIHQDLVIEEYGSDVVSLYVSLYLYYYKYASSILYALSNMFDFLMFDNLKVMSSLQN